MKILIVDDDPAVVVFFKQVAKAKGHTDISTALSGEEALGKGLQAEYDLITLDIKMPGIGGLEILSLLRNMSPHAIIAIVSGHFPQSIPDETAGCADVMICKPVSVEALNRLLDAAALICKTLEGVRLLEDVTFASD